MKVKMCRVCGRPISSAEQHIAVKATSPIFSSYDELGARKSKRFNVCANCYWSIAALLRICDLTATHPVKMIMSALNANGQKSKSEEPKGD